jgi:hypothetical protein
LQGITFQSQDEWLAGIVAVLGQIPIETLQRVFEHWMKRLEWDLRTMAIPIHKLNIRWFSFLHLPSGTDPLRISEFRLLSIKFHEFLLRFSYLCCLIFFFSALFFSSCYFYAFLF